MVKRTSHFEGKIDKKSQYYQGLLSLPGTYMYSNTFLRSVYNAAKKHSTRR